MRTNNSEQRPRSTVPTDDETRVVKFHSLRGQLIKGVAGIVTATSSSVVHDDGYQIEGSYLKLVAFRQLDPNRTIEIEQRI